LIYLNPYEEINDQTRYQGQYNFLNIAIHKFI